MAGFKGRTDGSVDAKGRLSIPSKYRKLLPEELVLAKHPDKEIPALVVYTSEGFESWFNKLLESKGGDKPNNSSQEKLIEEIYSAAVDVTPDSIGRITVPTYLREYADIEREAIIIGARDHLIIRAPEMWKKREESFATISAYDDYEASDNTESITE